MECIEGDNPRALLGSTQAQRRKYKASRTAMDAEDLVVDDHGKREEVEHVREVCPDVGRSIFSHTLGVEPIRLAGRKT